MARIPYANEGASPEIAALAEQIRRERGGKVPNLYRMLLNSPPIARGWLNLLTAVRQQSRLRARYRELSIIRVAVVNVAQYEYRAHIPFALREGITQAEIDAVSDWKSSSVFGPVEKAVLAYTDAMTEEVQVPADIFNDVAQHFDAQELTELTVTIAAYNMVSRFLEATEVDAEK
jgi:alkylhydroperoxidase family enzyme